MKPIRVLLFHGPRLPPPSQITFSRPPCIKITFLRSQTIKLLFLGHVGRKHFFYFCIEELEECKNKSHLPTRKQAYIENCKLTRIQKSDVPVKSLIA